MRWTLERLRELYNAALEQRREAYRRQGVSLSRYGQEKEIKDIRRETPEYSAIHFHLLQDAIRRLDLAYQAFFRRVKAGEKAGFPRFRGRGRYTSFLFSDAQNRNGAAIDTAKRRLRLTGIGHVKINIHRPIEGRLKQVTITLSGDGHWYACLCCDDVPTMPLPATGQSVGIDVGIRSFATLSTGEQIKNPRYYERDQAKIRRAQRRLARRKRGSHRRRKAVLLLRKQHDKIRRTRLDFHHKAALDLVRRFDAIAFEKLNIKGLARGRLAKQVNDAAWGNFLRILHDKAECAGREVWEVDPRGTSQRCSGCGVMVPKTLAVRVHSCPDCGLVLDRDENAARNIHAAGHAVRGGLSNG